VNEAEEGLAIMYMTCAVNRRKQIASAERAANILQYQGMLVPPPPGIHARRWRAMVHSTIIRGIV